MKLIRNLLKDGNNNNLRPEENSPPPNYEDPPAYDEIIKIGMESEIKRGKRENRSARKNQLNRTRFEYLLPLRS